MDELLKKILDASGVSGCESEIAGIMQEELKKVSEEVFIDHFGNVVARLGKGGKKIMLAAHMDEVGLMVKQVTKEGFLNFIKIGGIDDRLLAGQPVTIKAKNGDVAGVIGTRPIHLQKQEERKQTIKYEDMFIDIGCFSKQEAQTRVSLADPVVFAQQSGKLNGSLCYAKAVDNRLGCYAMIKVMERLKSSSCSEVYAVATVQEEVGLKGARVSSFKIAPDFALVIDTSIAGDTPQVSERESILKLGAGAAITIIEAAGRGFIVNQKVKDLLVTTARDNKISFQMDIIEGGMTDAAVISLNREGILTAVLGIPCRYAHSPVGVFCLDDIDAVVRLAAKSIERVASQKL